jgi:hypothetical protein
MLTTINKYLFFLSTLFFARVGFSQFNYPNNFGVGVNLPVLLSVYGLPLTPALQLDYRHEFMMRTRRYYVDKSWELRAGLDACVLPRTYLYMANLGFQYSYNQSDYLQAWGLDLLGFMTAFPLNTEVILGIHPTGQGQGYGLGAFYKFGRRISDRWSVTAEVGMAATMDNYTVWYFHDASVWHVGFTPNFALYRGNLSVNYHF